MADRKWTPAQQAAIQDESGSLLISAAAGSGKTAVLVERAVRLITKEENPVAADRLLILTFTNAAAEELRSRIAVSLEKAAARSGSVFIKKQRMLLKRAFIGTIDAFCQQLVKEHFTRLDVPPDVSVGDTALLEGIAQQAMDETMEEMYANEDFASFASLYGRARSDAQAEAAVRMLYDFTLTLPSPEKQLMRMADMYSGSQPLCETEWGAELLEYAANALESAHALALEAEKIAAADGGLDSYLEALESDIYNIERTKNAVESRDWDAAYKAVHGFEFASFKAVRGYEGTGKDVVQAIRKNLKKIIADLEKYCFVCTQEEYIQDLQQAGPMVRALCDAALMFSEKLYKAKLEEHVLYFPDFEHLALKLMRDEDGARTPEAERISGRYDAVMVDEYQDTNELQSALYESLGRSDGSNLFYVGDVKQSIYRFRKANPEIFVNKKQAWAPYGSGGSPAVITLGHNFRSGCGVIGGVNHVFGMLMSSELGEVDYTQDEKLIQGSEGGDPEGFELRLLSDPDNTGDAKYVARRIAEMVESGYKVREQNGMRPCNYGDFCVLMRARSHMQEYLAELEALGIPVVSDSSDDLLLTPEVLPIIAAISAIDNPGDEVNLASALLGPLFRFSPDELNRLRLDKPNVGLWEAAVSSSSPKVQKFVETIRFYSALSREMPAGRLCGELVERTGYLSAVTAMDNGAARRENLLTFIGWANSVSETGKGGLSGFIRILESGRGPSGSDFKNLPGHVSLLTIHKSKGLEFPVCILADTGHSFNRGDLDSRVPMHSDLGIGMWLRAGNQLYPTIPARAVRRRIEKEAQSEEMRVLYVALTRAKDRMIITFPHKDPGALINAQCAKLSAGCGLAYLHSMSGRAGEWVLSAALCHPDTAELLVSMGIEQPVKLKAEGRFITTVETTQQGELAEQTKYKLTAEPCAKTVQALLESFSTELPRAALSALPAKVSVSAITKKELPAIRKRPGFMYKSGLTAAEKGTLQHSFMQFANLQDAKLDLEKEINRLQASGYLGEDGADIIDRQGIEGFLCSNLAARMLDAKTLYREYDFMTSLPAQVLDENLAGPLAEEKVMVQGIADAVLVNEGWAEIVDYKTDRCKNPDELAARYSGQLRLYKKAISRRLGLPVKKLTIWSFHLGQEVDVPPEESSAEK